MKPETEMEEKIKKGMELIDHLADRVLDLILENVRKEIKDGNEVSPIGLLTTVLAAAVGDHALNVERMKSDDRNAEAIIAAVFEGAMLRVRAMRESGAMDDFPDVENFQ